MVRIYCISSHFQSLFIPSGVPNNTSSVVWTMAVCITDIKNTDHSQSPLQTVITWNTGQYCFQNCFVQYLYIYQYVHPGMRFMCIWELVHNEQVSKAWMNYHTPQNIVECNYLSMPKILLVVLNSLWPSDTIWWHRTWSTLAQVMDCWLMAPSHYHQ